MKAIRLSLILALVGSSNVALSAPPPGKGPKPAPEPTECQLDISGRMQCAYATYDECRAAMRVFRREGYDLASGCWLSTADPSWWHYDQYVLEYWP